MSVREGKMGEEGRTKAGDAGLKAGDEGL
jgi:hypothetical protein